MTDSHTLLCQTFATLYNEDSWDTVGDALVAEEDADALRFALEELLVIAAGLAIMASGALEVDPLNLIDSHYEMLRAEVATQDE